VEMSKAVGESSPKCSQNNENRFLVQVVGACSFPLEMRGRFRVGVMLLVRGSVVR
jgi:hypothetical protein